MSDIWKRIAGLSAEKRALLGVKLAALDARGEGRPVVPRRAPAASYSMREDQVYLWHFQQAHPDSTALHVAREDHFEGPLAPEVLERALNEVIRRHESLRTVFVQRREEEVTQVVLTNVRISLECIDLRQFSRDEREARTETIVVDRSRRRFDLSEGPMIRATLIRLEDEIHRLVMCLHHLVIDWFSFQNLEYELATIYAAFSEGRDHELEELPIQLADYAVWHRKWFQGRVREREIDYWKKQLAGAPTIMELPTDRPRPSVKTYSGRAFYFSFPKTLMEALEELSRRERVSLLMTIEAAYAALLHRYTGQDEIIVGTPSGNRSRAGTERLIGYIMNVVPLRNDLRGDPTFREFLTRVRTMAVGAYAHADLPLGRLVEAVRPERRVDHSVLFQTLFIFLFAQAPAFASPRLVRASKVDTRETEFDLTVALWRTPDGLSGRAEYNCDLFDRSTIERFTTHLETLLTSAVRNPERRISELDVMPCDEKERLNRVESHPCDVDAAQTIPSLFAERVRRSPDALALVSGTEHISYRELDRRSSAVAHGLRSLGLEAEGRVGVCDGRSAETVIAYLGVLKAGGAIVYLDPSSPLRRLASVVEDTGMRIVVTRDEYHELLDELGLACIDIERLSLDRRSRVAVHVAADQLAYVIFTSGSTGRPKGAMGLHRASVNRLGWMWDEYPFSEREMCCHKTSLNFVDSIWEVFGPLLAGVPATIVSDEALRSPGEFIDLLARHAVTRLGLVPSLLGTLMESGLDFPVALPALRFWSTSGETLGAELAREFAIRIPQGRLLNLYGLSEAAGDSSAFECIEGNVGDAVSIGTPIRGTTIRILDRFGHAAPIGVWGELHIAGSGLARGYVGDVAATASKFVPDAGAHARAGSRLYRTGDVCRYGVDERLEYGGRADHQVKIRGMRVELDEVAVRLRESPAVKDAVVVASSGSRDDTLIAFLKVTEDYSMWQARKFVSSYLPSVMMPAKFVEISEWPLLPTGKIDRRALLECAHGTPEAPRTSPPKTDMERTIAGIWCSILNRDEVGRDDHFFDVGGTSLLSMSALWRIERDVGVRLSHRDLMLRSLRQLSEICEDECKHSESE